MTVFAAGMFAAASPRATQAWQQQTRARARPLRPGAWRTILLLFAASAVHGAAADSEQLQDGNQFQAPLGRNTSRPCDGRWWRRVSDGLLLREPRSGSGIGGMSQGQCGRYVEGGDAVWTDVELPPGIDLESWAGTSNRSGGTLLRLQGVEVRHGATTLFQEAAASQVEERFTVAGRRCTSETAQALAGSSNASSLSCDALADGDDFRGLSERNGQTFCADPEAKESRAYFCRYPPRFYGHQGICRQYSQFCPFDELNKESDIVRLETAVVNVDSALFHSLETCGSLHKELWIFKVFVHWCPHCQQLMPRLYRLALVLRQRGVARVRFGAINCATEHALCGSQKWQGHPLLVTKYLGPDKAVHDAIEHLVEAVKDAQLRAMLPRYAIPGEYPLLRLLFEQLPEDMLPTSAWQSLFDTAADGADAGAGACVNLTALHPRVPDRENDTVGNGWSDYEADFTPRRHWTDALLIVRHTLQEWVVPLGDDGNVEAFSYQQVEAVEAWVAALAANLPLAFGLRSELLALAGQLHTRLTATTIEATGGLCASEWRIWLQPLLQRIAVVGERDFAVPSACGTDTCRMWSLLHTLSAEGLYRPLQQQQQPDVPATLPPDQLVAAVKVFLEQFFKCLYCRRHFLQQFSEGSYGLADARQDPAQAVLYFWRLHNAVSVRVAAEARCDEVDRRWPPISLCADCWHVDPSSRWPVLVESESMPTRSPEGPRTVRYGALPNETAVLRYLLAAFTEDNATVAGVLDVPFLPVPEGPDGSPPQAQPTLALSPPPNQTAPTPSPRPPPRPLPAPPPRRPGTSPPRRQGLPPPRVPPPSPRPPGFPPPLPPRPPSPSRLPVPPPPRHAPKAPAPVRREL